MEKHHISVLSRGPKFCPTTNGRKSDTCGDSYNLGRKLSIREIFHESHSNDKSLLRKPSKKYIQTKNKELSDIIATINKIEPKESSTISNISEEEEIALEEIKRLTKTTLEIKKADKTSTIVIMNKVDYRDQLVTKCHLQTNAYQQVNNNTDKTVYKNLKSFCNKHFVCLTDNEIKVILDEDWSTSNLYVLPKINKCRTILDEIDRKQEPYIQMPMPEDLTSRPIVSGPKSVTKGISKLLEKILTPLVEHQRTYIKDERDFLRKFPKNIGADCYIICCDIISLYTSIPNSLGLRAIEYWIEKLPEKIPTRFTKEFILEGVQFVLENNFFCFNNTTWHQIVGTAMGKEVASPYACLTVGFLEETILFPILIPASFEHEIAQKITKQFFRFVDDGITAPPKTVDPYKFQSILNSMDASIQYTITESATTVHDNNIVNCVNFLPLKVYTTTTGKVLTDVYYKETNAHEYLHYDSHHPAHVKNNIPYCLAKTIIVLTSSQTVMETNLNDLRTWLRNCGYPKNIIERGIFNARLQGPANAPSKKENIPFISTYYGNYDSSNIIETAKNLIDNSKNHRIQQVFKDVNFIHARRQPPNIIRQITSATFISDEKKTKENGIFCCKRPNCKICQMYLQECKSFNTKKGEWLVKSHAHCNSKNVIYFQICNFCNHECNLGKADEIRARTNNHISCSKNGTGTVLFDKHCYECPRQRGITPSEPYFKLYIMMVLNDFKKLRAAERNLHLQNHDTINATNTL